jgi:hypothetical protein
MLNYILIDVKYSAKGRILSELGVKKIVRWDFGYCGHYWPIVPALDDR